ncbi:MAG TPA: hypothetical protein VI318_05115 [Baekduia sp.]
MTQESIARARLFLWSVAADVWDFEIDPPLADEDLADLTRGTFTFRAKREAQIGGVTKELLLEVRERWAQGGDPLDDRRLEAEGCFLEVAKWMIQVADGGDRGAERLDVIPMGDDRHPRVHRHPFGETNDTRNAVPDLPVPEAWLRGVDDVLGGALSDPDLDAWDDLPLEDEAE